MTLHNHPLQNLVDTSNPHCYIIFYFISKVCFIQGAPRKLRPHFPQKCKGAPELFKLGPEVLSQIEITRKTSSKQGLPCSKSARIQRGREQGAQCPAPSVTNEAACNTDNCNFKRIVLTIASAGRSSLPGSRPTGSLTGISPAYKAV